MELRRKTLKLMGSHIDILIFDSVDAETILDDAVEMLKMYEHRFSANDDSSELMEVNHNAGIKAVKVHPDLFDLIEKKQDNLIIKFRLVAFGIIFSIPLSAIALVLEFNYARFIFGYISLLLIGFLSVHFFAYRITKQEKEEVKQLPKSFKNYMLGEPQDFNKDFFNDKTTSYLDPFFKDSTIYPYVKAKYTKKESDNGIINE